MAGSTKCSTVFLSLIASVTCSSMLQAQDTDSENAGKNKAVEEVVVWGSNAGSRQAEFTNPTSLLGPDDFEAINIATTEDTVKYEPSIIIRRRYIGDSNGTLGLRGSNMFQTTRSMVFADGVPLHYFLQGRWNGAPRWTMVSASEIAQVEIIYGPFSAEYSGNAMGGVINIETAIPQKSTFHFDSSYFSQDFEAYGFSDTLNGYKSFMSYGDKVGNLSYYLSYNHLENDSQPQSYYFDGDGTQSLATATGSVVGKDVSGNPVHFFSDSGVENAETDNYKLKIGYEFGEWMALLNVAYEDRTTTRDSANPYIFDQNGNPIYSGDVDLGNGDTLTVNPTRLGISFLDRESLNTGLRLRGPIADNIELEANVSRFDVKRDETRASRRNPADPLYTLDGQITDYDDTGWSMADVKVTFADVGVDGMEVITGLRRESYELGISVYNSSNYIAGEKTSINNQSGGETQIEAAFAQMNWVVNSSWDLALGLRYESWQTRNGYYNTSSTNIDVPHRDDDKFSPKFSLGYKPSDRWLIRYSLAKAYRFPIVEELFDRSRRFNAASEAVPDLNPENGLHHNIMIDYTLDQGYLRVNLFHDRVKDAIESFTDSQSGIRTFHSMGEVETTGVEFIANTYDWIVEGFDIRFNLTYTDAEIVSNPGEPAWEGKTPIRMPEWRSNLMATYRVTDQWNVSANLQYADDAFGSMDNSDTQHNVFGAQDGYTRVGMTTNYDFRNNFKLGFGIDNITNEIAYVAHPWPGRTMYLNLSYDF